jgi:hypothetical protein
MKPAPRDGSIQRYVQLTGAPQGPIGHHPPSQGVLNLELVDARVGVEELPAGQSGQMEMARSTLVS